MFCPNPEAAALRETLGCTLLKENIHAKLKNTDSLESKILPGMWNTKLILLQINTKQNKDVILCYFKSSGISC